MSAFVITNMDQDLCSGVGARYSGGDPVVTGADLELLKCLMKEEVERNKGMGLGVTVTGGASACRAGAPALSPAPAPSANSTAPTYPPTKGVRHAWVTSFMEADKQCVCCFSTDRFHLDNGCPILAKEGLIPAKDADAAAAIVERYKAK